MLNKDIKICKILTFSEDDLLSFSLEFSASGVEVVLIKNDKEIIEEEIPQIVVGWSNVKRLFPKQRISQRKISDNISWVYSVLEDKPNTISDTKSFIRILLLSWLPDTYVPYDCVLDGKLSKFLEKNFTQPYKLFVYFSGKAMYMYNTSDYKKIIGVSLESLKYSGFDVKKVVTAIMEKYSPVCLSYVNVSSYLTENHEPFFETIENIFWAKYFEEVDEKSFNDFIMGIEPDKFIPFVMSEIYKRHVITEQEKTYIHRLNKKDIITSWLSKREMYFDKKYNNEKIEFKKSSDGMQYVRLSYSNKRTITGRINCSDRRFNPQMLPKDSEDRKMIVSRFKKGKIIILDYVSFETKLSLFLSQDIEFIKKFKDKDLHEETAKIIFQKKQLNSKERLVGKSINHALLYGGGDERLKKILSNVIDQDLALERVKEFLSPIIDFSKQIQNSCEEIGYMTNSFGTIIKPQKSWASFSNFVSAIAADILVDKLYLIKDYLSDKKSKFIFQVHDSFVFDIHPDEYFIVEELKNILSNFKEIKLQVETSEGNNLYECTVSEEFSDVQV